LLNFWMSLISQKKTRFLGLSIGEDFVIIAKVVDTIYTIS